MTSQNLPTLSVVPEGYTYARMDDGRKVLMPNIMWPHWDFAFNAYRTKQRLGVTNAPPRLGQGQKIEQVLVAGELLKVPPNPLLSGQEKLALHAEVIALQNQLGISYKDAAHRLYMAEVEKLILADKESKAWATLLTGIDTSLDNLAPTRDTPNRAENTPRTMTESIDAEG